MKRIIYTRPDGGISIVIPVINTIGEIEGFTEDDALARAMAKLPTDAINPQIVEESDIPTDRTFRNAWEFVNGQVVVNETKKQAIIDANQAIIDTKASALTKLTALGLTQDEIKAIVG
jgi:hypothetical protein